MFTSFAVCSVQIHLLRWSTIVTPGDSIVSILNESECNLDDLSWYPVTLSQSFW